MSDEKRALTRHSAPPSEADYEAILAAVMETGRGRWFLHEFAHRNRHTETRGVLTAIERLEGMLRAQGGDVANAPAHPAAGQIATAIARAQEMVAAYGVGEDAHAFDIVGQILENAQVRVRGVYTRLRDTAAGLREEGGHSRICNELDRQVRDLDAGCGQIEDASGDIRILIALLKDIESLAGEAVSLPPQTEADAAPAPADEPLPEALVVTPVAVPPTPQNDPVETGLMVSDTVTLEELEACEAEFEESEPEIAAASEQIVAATVAAETPIAAVPSADLAAPADLATPQVIEAEAPQTIKADALVSEPADFLLEPLPEDEPETSLAPDAEDSPESIEIELERPEEKPLAPLRLDSFDPLAPLRMLSDEEKVALFS
jgi:chemotaxis protein CheZ